MTFVRSALFNLFFFGVTFILTWPATLVRLVAPHRVLAFIAFWARLLIAAARIICGIRVRVLGLENIPPGAALIASGHQSAFDTFVWFTLVPDCCYVLKRELTKIPLFGDLITAAGQIPIDREAGATAVRSLLRDGTEALKDGRQVVIFPEGTRSEPGTVGALQPGIAALAARTGLPVIPVATDSGLCWSRKAFVKHPGVITIAIGAPLPPCLSRPVLMAALAERFESLLPRPAQDVQGQGS